MRKRRPRNKKTPQLKSLMSMQRAQNDAMIYALSSQADILQSVEYVQQQQATDRKLSLSQYERIKEMHEASYHTSKAIAIFQIGVSIATLFFVLCK
jgi:hypothetical protein